MQTTGLYLWRVLLDTTAADPKKIRMNMEVTENSNNAMYRPDKSSQATEPFQAKGLVKTFGPSRPVSLPPARRGGRKSVLPLEKLKKRREARKQGVCIRCRQLKSQVSNHQNQRHSGLQADIK